MWRHLRLLVILLATTGIAQAQDNLRAARTTALRLTIAEAVLATNAQMSDRAGSPIKEMGWKADLGDRNWSLFMKGTSERGPVEVVANGYLWGGEGEDWTVSYAAMGRIGDEPILINGKMDWPKANSDRLTVGFNQVTKFGTHSTWAWIHGTEAILGAVVGGTAAVAATAAVPPYSILVGVIGAIGGANATVSFSDTISKVVAEELSPPPLRRPLLR
jgi:hypothetical protein